MLSGEKSLEDADVADAEKDLSKLEERFQKMEFTMLFSGETRRLQRGHVHPCGRGRHGRPGLGRDAHAHVLPLR